MTTHTRNTIQTYIALKPDEYHRLTVIARTEKKHISELLAEKAREVLDVYYPPQSPRK